MIKPLQINTLFINRNSNNSLFVLRFITPFFFVYWVSILSIFGQKEGISLEKMPVPATSAVRLFYVQRSPNINTVVYDVNLLPNKKINPEQPVNVYWVRYSGKGEKEPLNYLQRTLAYGVEATPIANEAGSFDGRVVSYKKRRLKIMLDATGSPMALTNINGKQNQLLHVFVMIEETGKLIPKVLYIELFGRDTRTGADVYERFKP